ncbi:MAG: glycoside hydrolase family 27 protein [Solirubrobacteraceae bacterium]|jgi:alpha-galactosidase
MIGRRLAAGAIAAVIAGVLAAPAPALDNGLARTPPMGWSSWYPLRCQVNEQVVRETAHAMIASGMRAAGYRYVNLDDCWMARTRRRGQLRPDPAKFPHGMRALAAYLHRRGLKLGIYAAAGRATCMRFPGSRRHLYTDARTFASWRVDYLKLDGCFTTRRERGPQGYGVMQSAIRWTRHPMVLSISAWGLESPWVWAANVGHLWRTTPDIHARWSSMMRIVDHNAGLAGHARPGAWNDPDMLQVGNRGLRTTEGKSMFSLWSMMAAPLIAGNDLRAMSRTTRGILTNREVIAVDQDPAGVQGFRASSVGGHEVWIRPLASGDRALLLVNRSRARAMLGADARQLGLRPSRGYVVRDLWLHRTSTTPGPVTAFLPAHGVAMFRVRSG